MVTRLLVPNNLSINFAITLATSAVFQICKILIFQYI